MWSNKIIETYLLNVNGKIIITEYDNGGRIIDMCRKRFEDIMDNKINGDGEKLEEFRYLAYKKHIPSGR